MEEYARHRDPQGQRSFLGFCINGRVVRTWGDGGEEVGGVCRGWRLQGLVLQDFVGCGKKSGLHLAALDRRTTTELRLPVSISFARLRPKRSNLHAFCSRCHWGAKRRCAS